MCGEASTGARKKGPGMRKGPAHSADPSPKIVRQRPTLPHGPPCSTIGAIELSFRVRNVTGRFPYAITTETLRNNTNRPHTTQIACVAVHGCCLRTYTVDASKLWSS